MAGREHVPTLDGLRGCAILAVLSLHFTAGFSAPATAITRLVTQAFSLGWSGVDLFFVLSGFLITGILADARDAPGRFRTFYARRALRILPLYYGFVAALFVIPVLVGAATYTTPFAEQVPYYLYVQNIWGPRSGSTTILAAHLWSLAIEEQFYLVWPLVVFKLSRTAALRVSLACVVGALMYRAGCAFVLNDLRSVYFSTPGRIDGLALGSAIALIARAPEGMVSLQRWAPWAVAGGAAAFAGAAWHPSGFNAAGTYVVVVGYSALAFLFGGTLVIVLDSAPQTMIHSVLSSRVLRYFGRYSYGLYVLHVPLIALARAAGVAPEWLAGTRWDWLGLIAYVVLLTGVSLLAALASWTLYEQPFLRLKSYFSYRTKGGARQL